MKYAHAGMGKIVSYVEGYACLDLLFFAFERKKYCTVILPCTAYSASDRVGVFQQANETFNPTRWDLKRRRKQSTPTTDSEQGVNLTYTVYLTNRCLEMEQKSSSSTSLHSRRALKPIEQCWGTFKRCESHNYTTSSRQHNSHPAESDRKSVV